MLASTLCFQTANLIRSGPRMALKAFATTTISPGWKSYEAQPSPSAPLALLPGDTWESSHALSECAVWTALNAIGHALKPRRPRQTFNLTTRAVAVEAVAPSAGAAILRERLDFKPELSWAQVLLCLLASAVVCAAVHGLTAPAAFSVWYAVRMAGLCAVVLTATRNWLHERQYAGKLMDVTDLGNADSNFRQVGALNVHYTLQHATDGQAKFRPHRGTAKATAVHCMHGFGANTASWAYLRQPLADALGAQVTAHDMPGFGLTERPKDAGKFTLGFNGRVGRVLMDCELAASSVIPPFNIASAAGAPTLESSTLFPQRLGREDWGEEEASGVEEVGVAAQADQAAPRVRRVLMGHSMGAICATAEAIQHPEGLAALVLIAPAMVALPMHAPAEAAGKPGHMASTGQSVGAGFAHMHLAHPGTPPRRPRWLQRAVSLLRALVWPIAFLWVRLMILVTKPLLVLGLRAAVRSRAFWLKGLRSSWHSSHKLPEELVDAYRAPQLVRGWEDGLIRFFLARVSGRGVIATLRETFLMHEIRQPATGHVRQLAALAASQRIKVLIMHGQNDVLLPVSNSRRLAALIPHAHLVVFPDCGHSPQEEVPHSVVAAIQRFLEATDA